MDNKDKDIESLEKRIKDLEKKSDKSKEKQDLLNKTLMKIVFYGAVASGITAICQLVIFILNFFKNN